MEMTGEEKAKIKEGQQTYLKSHFIASDAGKVSGSVTQSITVTPYTKAGEIVVPANLKRR